ncbi:MAG: uroporphyrinogen decarboxylase family protein [Promethearchaeota archaeon]|jgi:uroporphyrinogen decarboxylase
MNSYERVIKALNLEEPDRVPLFNQAIMPEFKKRLLDLWGKDYKKERRFTLYYRDFNIEKKLGFDMSWGYEGFPLRLPPSVLKENPLPLLKQTDRYVDIDGRIFLKNLLMGSDDEWYLKNYITTEEDADFFYETYYAVEWEENLDLVPKINSKLKKFSTEEFVPCSHLSPILEPIWMGLGLGLFAKLLRKNRNKLKKFINLRTDIAVAGAKILAETDFDVFFICDDTAFKNRTMINPKDHQELIIPAYKKILHQIKQAGKYAVFHSDGFTEPYFDGLIEAGFNGVESLEPNAGMDLKFLKETYGDKLCLIGNIDVSQLLPFGTKNEVEKAVKQCIKDAGEGGGYILSPCTDLTNACKVENVISMITAAKKLGTYPLIF